MTQRLLFLLPSVTSFLTQFGGFVNTHLGLKYNRKDITFRNQRVGYWPPGSGVVLDNIVASELGKPLFKFKVFAKIHERNYAKVLFTIDASNLHMDESIHEEVLTFKEVVYDTLMYSVFNKDDGQEVRFDCEDPIRSFVIVNRRELEDELVKVRYWEHAYFSMDLRKEVVSKELTYVGNEDLNSSSWWAENAYDPQKRKMMNKLVKKHTNELFEKSGFNSEEYSSSDKNVSNIEREKRTISNNPNNLKYASDIPKLPHQISEDLKNNFSYNPMTGKNDGKIPKPDDYIDLNFDGYGEYVFWLVDPIYMHRPNEGTLIIYNGKTHKNICEYPSSDISSPYSKTKFILTEERGADGFQPIQLSDYFLKYNSYWKKYIFSER